jgi:hypothetical protein
MTRERSQGQRQLDAVLLSAGPYEQVTNLTAAVGFSAIPSNTETAVIVVEGQDIRWTDDGVTTPTATVGMLLKKDSTFVYNGEIKNFKAIEVAASAKLNVSYYT